MLQLIEKLKILGDAAKYDVSCASSGINRGSKSGGIGNTVGCGICHSFSEDGRCISLLKVLMSNACCYDCVYCYNRCSHDIPRASFTPQELAELTIEFYKRNYIEGLFLSSAVVKSPDYTMELFIKVLTLLRGQYRFNGYIHAKIIPGASEELIKKIGLLADRVSVNMEFATKKSMAMLAGDKNHESIISPMSYVKKSLQQNKYDIQKFKSAPNFIPAGQTTQMIIGASGERDLTILKLTDALYSKMRMRRVYYSAYVPVVSDPHLPAITTMPPLNREHRLYQADFLLRFYSFGVHEIVDEENPNLDLEVDPKVNYALKHPDLYPIEVNRADYETLLRVPGIGQTSARRIIEARRYGGLNESDLKKIGVVLKRARFFITAKGKFLGSAEPGDPFLRNILKDDLPFYQTSLFDKYTTVSTGFSAKEEQEESLLPMLVHAS